MDRLHSELHGDKILAGCPAINIAETASGYLMEMALPGYRKQDLLLAIEDDVLIVQGCSSCVPAQYEEVQRFYKKEFGIESFCRSFLLPEDVENVKATYEGGILAIQLQKGAIHKCVVDGVCERVTIPIQ
ncbi:Hsp20/alpha crystallin family protein [Paraflavitalea pollutisoli]|uniref:Hsp20/alpha crystallin family protein n=1 Tax=Paraflavitalea pollutisoli TaxID=3034143 RepID=UPI0023EB4BCA|nr:Hsp20/alpha crystallin family protein [Paraflavitalea sp. H1-2-19X]